MDSATPGSTPGLTSGLTRGFTSGLTRGFTRDHSRSRNSQGLRLKAFDANFDAHFNTRSDFIERALQGVGPVADRTEQCALLQQTAEQPGWWGLRVELVWQLWEYIAGDINPYAAAHGVNADGIHTCYVKPCGWRHCGEQARVCDEALPLDAKTMQLRPDMHLVVRRYVKPWTKGFNTGLARVLNAGIIAHIQTLCTVDCCKAAVFISHSWNENFQEFATTLVRNLHMDTAVWVCSFALNQNGDIAGSLGDLESCPFAVAMGDVRSVLVVTDHSAEALERCWVVLEAAVALKKGKQWSISLSDNFDVDMWRTVGQKLDGLDVRQCKASYDADKQAIIRYAQAEGGINRVNEAVRVAARRAMRNAEIAADARSGDVARLPPEETLLSWRTQKGGTYIHVCAGKDCVLTMVKALQRVHFILLEEMDRIGRTPLAVAAENGSLAAAQVAIDVRGVRYTDAL
eukprot:TRINITY_DN12067_c0_g1_i2.p1 TRINITY_DN12067_c0_g1~~TRINITY_DN12067_c0_g1_i2.p1  ORF type:complete len:458 (+),score=66.07 TRINITY_DN12067_c0_g1_i2:30-1403(+)